MDEWIIESEDGKLWYGGGAWTDQRDKAKRYTGQNAAQTDIDKFAMKGRATPFSQGGEQAGGDEGSRRNSTNASE